MTDNGAGVRGVLKIEIGEPALELALTLEASEDGDLWTTDSLQQALRERGLKTPPEHEELERYLTSAANANGEPHRAVLLQGVPAEPATPDTITYNEDLTIPEDIEGLAEQVISESPPPEIYTEIKEAVKTTREVEGKSRIPFLQAKSTTEEVTETRVRRERVPVDPKPIGYAWAEEGAYIGTVTPRAMGIPGKDILGRTLAAKQIADPGFYLGDNVSRQGERVLASTTGLVRKGRNWVDIVPFRRHEWKVELSDDRATCYLVLTPGHHAYPPPDPAAVRQAAIDVPYPEDSLVPESEIVALIESALVGSQTQRLPISHSRDGSFDIIVSEDKLAALLNIHKGKGRGNPISLKAIGAAIKSSGLRGLDFKKISTDITAFQQSEEFDLTGYVLAEGRAPTRGPEREVEYAVTFDKEAKTESVRARLIEHLESGGDAAIESLEEFPPTAITRTASVQADQRVCSVDPPTPGEDGIDVYGTILKGEPGPGVEFVLHENVSETNHVIAATVTGILDLGESDGVVHLRVRAQRDAEAQVAVSDDGSEARLTLIEGAGAGERLSTELIDRALSSAGVTHGIDTSRIETALSAARAGTDVNGLVVAVQTPPVDQNDHQVEWQVDLDGTQAVRIRKDGSADYRTRTDSRTVPAGTEICRVLPAEQEAVDGTDVRGATLQAKRTSGTPIEFGDNVTTETLDDGTVVARAETDGEIVFEKSKLSILTQRMVKGDVDMSVGNIRFPGTVIVGGSVRAGFYVMAEGDIKIAGAVEAALLSADGDIIVKQGVKGAGKAVLRAKKQVMSPYVELATVMAVGNMVLKTAAVRSRIKCNGKITFQGDKGRVVGGVVRARDGIEVLSVGSDRGVATQLSFGQDYLVADLIEKEEREIDKVKQRITEVDLAMRKAERAGSTDSEELQGLRDEKVKLLKLMQKRGLRLFTLRERFEQHFDSRIIVKGDVFAGTVFESHGRTYEITSTRKGVVVDFDPQTGNIGISDLSEAT